MTQLLLLSRLGHSPIYLLAFWAGAFLSLCWALVGLNVFLDVIESDSELMSLKKELVLAGVASAIEAIGVWALAAFVPAALGRGIFLPLIVTGMLYQVTHYDSWGRFEAIILLMLQIVLVLSVVAFILGYFLLAFVLVGGLFLFLTIFATIVKWL